MNPKKEKGRRLELKVAKLIRDKLGIKAYRMPYSGGSEFAKGDIFCPDLPFHFELKNQEKVRIWREWQNIRDFKDPVLVISRANAPILAVIDFEKFLEIVIKARKFDKYIIIEEK